jgi:hypothetical protein
LLLRATHTSTQARGCPLRSVLSVPTPAAQAQRLTAAGWGAAAAADMAAVYYGGSGGSSGRGGTASLGARLPANVCGSNGHTAAPAQQPGSSGSSGGNGGSGGGWLRPEWQAERRRIERLEMLDELEEWLLLQVRAVVCQGGMLWWGVALWGV